MLPAQETGAPENLDGGRILGFQNPVYVQFLHFGEIAVFVTLPDEGAHGILIIGGISTGAEFIERSLPETGVVVKVVYQIGFGKKIDEPTLEPALRILKGKLILGKPLFLVGQRQELGTANQHICIQADLMGFPLFLRSFPSPYHIRPFQDIEPSLPSLLRNLRRFYEIVLVVAQFIESIRYGDLDVVEEI
jgi:hypothetical protein